MFEGIDTGLLISVIITIVFFLIQYIKIPQVELNLHYGNEANHEKSLNKDKDIKVLYKNKEIENVTTTYLWLWNSGRKGLYYENIPKLDKKNVPKLKNLPEDLKDVKPEDIKLTLSIQDPGLFRNIFEFRELKLSSNQSQIRLLETEEVGLFGLHFNFINANEGAAFYFKHDGSIFSSLKLHGDILSPRKIKFKYSGLSALPIGKPTVLSRIRSISILSGLFLLLLLSAYSAYWTIIDFHPISKKDAIADLFFDIGTNLTMLPESTNDFDLGLMTIHRKDSLSYVVNIDSSQYNLVSTRGFINYKRAMDRGSGSLYKYGLSFFMILFALFCLIAIYGYFKNFRKPKIPRNLYIPRSSIKSLSLQHLRYGR